MNPQNHDSRPSSKRCTVTFLALMATAVACAGESDLGPPISSETGVAELTSASADFRFDDAPMRWTVFSDDIGSTGQSEARKLFTNDAAYRTYFGHSAPKDVNFDTDWVVFYSAGEKTSGSYSAEIKSIGRAAPGLMLSVVTRLVSPGSSCLSAQVLTKPYVLARFARPQTPVSSAKYYSDDLVRDCSSLPDVCATVLCAPGQRCVAEPGACTKESPCEPQPRCVTDAAPSCGGFIGKACAGAATCVDDPTDTCDPKSNGADCIGICECAPTAECASGHWDSSPQVCACVL